MELLTPKQVQERFGINASTLGHWRTVRCGPRFIQESLGKRVWYDLADLEAWFESKKVGTTDTVKASRAAVLALKVGFVDTTPGGDMFRPVIKIRNLHPYSHITTNGDGTSTLNVLQVATLQWFYDAMQAQARLPRSSKEWRERVSALADRAMKLYSARNEAGLE